MKTKELINKTFDKTIERLKKTMETEQVVDPEAVEKTDENISQICREMKGISKPKGL